MNKSYYKTYGALLVVALLSLTACSTAPVVPDVGKIPATPEVIAATLYELTKGYSTGDFERFISVFAPGATYQGNVVADNRDAWEADFNTLQYWRFSNINIHGSNAFVQFTEQGDNYCTGYALWTFNSEGLVQSVEAACAQTNPGDELPAGFDQAVAGQLADVGTTIIGTGAGLVEGNPIIAGMGLPAAAVLKVALSKYADTLPPQKCHDMKTGLSTVGWSAAAFNACSAAALVTTGGAAIPFICLPVAAIAGKAAYEQTSKSNIMQCWKQLEGSDKRYQRISAAGIVEEN